MTHSLITHLEALADQQVLVIGDIMLDRFIYGDVDRVSPEAPIPVLHIKREARSLGGAGNVVRNLVSLGGYADVVGVIGDDQTGYDLSTQLTELSHVTSYLFSDSSRPTTLKTRYVANGQQLLRADYEQSSPLSEAMEEQALLHIKSALSNSSVIILSDYAKGMLTPKIITSTIELARAKNRRVLVDPKGRDFRRYKGASFLTPNRKELTDAIGHPIRTPEEAQDAARALIMELEMEGMLVKLGSDGVCLVTRSETTYHFKTTAQEVFDVSGAGDTVMATLALGLAANLPVNAAAELANIAGSIVVGKVGTAVVTRDEISQALHKTESHGREQKVMTQIKAEEASLLWHKQGLTIGFTNGCFDLLHPGHISLIRQAKSHCDKLIVGLNSDASIKRLKGDSRPIQNQAARSLVLASLADVDGVVLFDEDTPYRLIKDLHPMVLVKGADYNVATVVGSDLVLGWGGKVILAQLVEGQSTTNTIAKLQAVK